MYLAQIQTAAGPLTIGLTNITLDQANATLSVLLELLSQVTDPIVLTNTDVYLREGPEGAAAAMTFRYLGSGTSVFADQDAYATEMNKNLSLNVFACPTDARPDDAGRIVVDFESFELIAETQEANGAGDAVLGE